MKGFPLYKWWTLQLAIASGEVNPTAVLVFDRMLAHHNNSTGLCNPTEETIARYVGRDERTVRTAIRDLERAKLISVEKVGTVPSRNHYTINFFLGDAAAFRRAEELGLARRKKPSAKQKKEHHKRTLRRKKVTGTGPGPNKPKLDRNKLRQRLEDRLADMLGSGEAGWKRLLEVEATHIEKAVDRLERGEIRVWAAAQAVLSEALEPLN